MASVLMPQQEQQAVQKSGGKYSNALKIGGLLAGGALGVATGGATIPAMLGGAVTGAGSGAGLGGLIGEMVDPEKQKVVGQAPTGVSNVPVAEKIAAPQSTAMDRRFNQLQEDPVLALTGAQKALEFQPKEIQAQYQPVINQALIQAQRQRRYDSGGIA